MSETDDPKVEKFLSGIEDEQRREDCLAVHNLMKELTGEQAVMWGKAMVGFGKFRYKGKTSGGEWFHLGYSPRKANLTLYFHCELEKQGELLGQLGKHKIGKSCLYVKRLGDVELEPLKALVLKAYESPAIAGAMIE